MGVCLLLTAKELYNEMMKQEHWDKTYDRFSLKDKLDQSILDEFYQLKMSNEKFAFVASIVSGTYKWSVPEKVFLAKSGTTKKRVVYMYSPLDRFLIGVLYRALSALYNAELAPNCFSYRTGVTTLSAIEYISSIKKNENLYGLKLDISAYFNSVSREYLIKCLDALELDSGIRQTMDNLFLDDTVSYKGEEFQEYKSLIAGCALGSFFANYCLKDIDWYFYKQNIVYARYSDDIIVMAKTQEEIQEYLEIIKTKLDEVGLSINPSKYVHFNPEDPVEYLGLKLSDDVIDIGNHAKMKLKATFKRWTKAGRKSIEMDNKDFETVARHLVKRWNWKIYKSYVEDPRKFGWGYYAFRYITTTESLTEIDFYVRDRLRAMKTGKNNKANVKALNDEDFRNLGLLSMYEMYELFHSERDYYLEVSQLI